jgi:hypothetical protein
MNTPPILANNNWRAESQAVEQSLFSSARSHCNGYFTAKLNNSIKNSGRSFQSNAPRSPKERRSFGRELRTFCVPPEALVSFESARQRDGAVT